MLKIVIGPGCFSYDPMGNRVWKNSTVPDPDTTRKYIVDVTGCLPVILMELNASEAVIKSYIYENSRIIAQRDGDQTATKYFYVNDRLGSVRQVIDMDGIVERNYTYSPFGQLLESGAELGAPSNPFMFTGQWFDDEISQYYLRARMYDPVLMRFTARDPVRGKFKDPMTLHKYLYCLNDPINETDPTGQSLYAALLGRTGVRAKLYAGMATTSSSFIAAVNRFVTTLNLQSYLMQWRTAGRELGQGVMWAMVHAHNAFANVASHGWLALNEFMMRWQTIDPGAPRDVFNVIYGPPGYPQTVSGGATFAIQQLEWELMGGWSDFQIWYEENYGHKYDYDKDD